MKKRVSKSDWNRFSEDYIWFTRSQLDTEDLKNQNCFNKYTNENGLKKD